jgi:7-keto-8-aminopelargonate synthetase-like enzyme
MRRDGVDAALLSQLSRSSSSTVSDSPAPIVGLIAGDTDRALAKYQKMAKNGLPEGAIRHDSTFVFSLSHYNSYFSVTLSYSM